MRDDKRPAEGNLEIPKSFKLAGRIFRSINPQDKERRTTFLLNILRDGKLKKWQRALEIYRLAYNKKQSEIAQKGGKPEWLNVLYDVSLDTNGLSIRLGPNNTGIFGHIPYHVLQVQDIAALLQHHYFSGSLLFELIAAVADAHHSDPEKILSALMQALPESESSKLQESIDLFSDRDSQRSIASTDFWSSYAQTAFNSSLYGHDNDVTYDTSTEKLLINHVLYKLLHEPYHILGYRGFVPTRVIDIACSDNFPNYKDYMHPEYPFRDRAARIARLFEIAEVESINRNQGDAWRAAHPETAIDTVRNSHTHIKIGQTLFASRSEQVRGPHMYNAIKIVKAILRVPAEELKSLGIHLIRGHFGTNSNGQNIECLGMYSPRGFHRIFLDPDKHLGYGAGTTPERHVYDALPITTTIKKVKDNGQVVEKRVPDSKDFYTLEAAMLPFNAFLRAAEFATFGGPDADIPTVARKEDGTIDKDVRVRALRGVRRLRSIIVTEVPEETYETLTIAIHRAVQHIRKGTFTYEHRNELKEVLKTIASKYAAFLTSKDPQTLIRELLAAPARIENVTYDGTFLEKLPPHIREYVAKEKGLPPETFASGARTTIVSALRGDIGYAREAQAWRALKLERRPTLLYTSGATFSPDDPEALAHERSFAKGFVELAFRYRANVFVPGTATHSTRILAEEYNKKLAEVCGKSLENITLEDRQKHAQCVFFEPGGSLIFPGNPHMPSKDDLRVSEIAVDLNGATTGHTAGWIGNGDNDVSYNRHIHARQVNINALTEGLIVPVLARNGGKWSAVEHQFAAYDNFHILAMKDSGRHSALIGHIAESTVEGKSAVDMFAQCDTLEGFTDALRSFVDRHPVLSQDKDLQVDVFGSRSKAYIPELFELLQSVEPKKLHAVSADSYLDSVEEYFKTQAAQIASEQR